MRVPVLSGIPDIVRKVIEALKVKTSDIEDDAVTAAKIAANVAGNGLGQNADGSLEVKTDGSTLEISSDLLQVKDKGITLAKQADIATSRILGRITAGTGITEVLTAANVLSILGLSTITSAWTQFTPSWNNLTIGSGGTNDGYYVQIGKIFIFRLQVVLGTSPTVGAVQLNFPVTVATYGGNTPIGLLQINDASPPAAYFGSIMSTGALRILNASSTYLTLVALSSTAPMAWAAGDSFTIQAICEVA